MDDVPQGSVGRGRGRARARGPRSVSPRAGGGPRHPSRSPTRAYELKVAKAGGEDPTEQISARVAAVQVSSSVPAALPKSEEIRGATRGNKGGDFGPDETKMKRPDDFSLRTRPENVISKTGNAGTPLRIITNFFKLKRGPMWTLHEYHVTFKPDVDNLKLRKVILRKLGFENDEQQQNEKIPHKLGSYIFNGQNIYLAHLIPDEHLICHFTLKEQTEPTEISFKYNSPAAPGSPTYMHFYAVMLRSCLYNMDLEQLGRHFYNPAAAIEVPNHKLTLWPGYITTLRQHEKDVLLCVESTHKVLRLDNALITLNQTRAAARGDPKLAILQTFKDTIIMTKYNRKTYHVDDIDFSVNPTSTFPTKNGPTTYIDYYQSKHKLHITDLKQPLIVCRPSKRDVHRGDNQSVYLIPELCQLTGLTESMRENFQLMKELSKHLHMGPQDRVNTINNFMKTLKASLKVTTQLKNWELDFEDELTPVQGRILPRQKIIFGTGEDTADEKADWTKSFRSQKLLSTINLDRWVIIVPQRDAPGVENLVRTMTKVAQPLNMRITSPSEVYKLNDIRPSSYISAIKDLHNRDKNLQMYFIILPNNKLETYSAVKKLLAHELGIPSQCFVAKNVTSKGLMSIATKVVIQMNAKLGGEPWSIKMPLKNMMVVGFDVYHGVKGSGGASVGAMVATTSPTLAKYYSTTSLFKDSGELSRNMQTDFAKCVDAYAKSNGALPERVLLFRDGVSEGQLSEVYVSELEQLKASMNTIYTKAELPIPKFTFVVVTKKIDTRLIADNRGRMENPNPGCVVDDVVTLPHRYDYFLISCSARQGTVSPCSYNVIHDTQGLDADKIQMLTYKMCHLYFNWSGTVAVPAPCQYAHKLAFITGTAYTKVADEKLSHLLHFL